MVFKNKARGCDAPAFKNMTPNANNIYFFTGLRRLMPTPYRYVIPALWWLKGEEKPIENIVPEIIIKQTKDKRTTPALNQTTIL